MSENPSAGLIATVVIRPDPSCTWGFALPEGLKIPADWGNKIMVSAHRSQPHEQTTFEAEIEEDTDCTFLEFRTKHFPLWYRVSPAASISYGIV